MFDNEDRDHHRVSQKPLTWKLVHAACHNISPPHHLHISFPEVTVKSPNPLSICKIRLYGYSRFNLKGYDTPNLKGYDI